jgi:hypothetical protein
MEQWNNGTAKAGSNGTLGQRKKQKQTKVIKGIKRNKQMNKCL